MHCKPPCHRKFFCCKATMQSKVYSCIQTAPNWGYGEDEIRHVATLCNDLQPSDHILVSNNVTNFVRPVLLYPRQVVVTRIWRGGHRGRHSTYPSPSHILYTCSSVRTCTHLNSSRTTLPTKIATATKPPSKARISEPRNAKMSRRQLPNVECTGCSYNKSKIGGSRFIVCL